MKMRSLFNLIEDAQEISELFARVETPEQMVSFLERLKKSGATELLEGMQALRLSVHAVLEDTFELGGTIGGDDDDDFDADENEEGDEKLLADLDSEDDEAPPESSENEGSSNPS